MDDETRDEYQSEVRRLRGELRAVQAGGDTASGAPSPPLRQRDIIRALLDERRAKAASQARATVRLTRNAKGDVQPEVLAEVNAETVELALADAKAQAVAVFDALCLVYSLDASPPARSTGKPANGSQDDA